MCSDGRLLADLVSAQGRSSKPPPLSQEIMILFLLGIGLYFLSLSHHLFLPHLLPPRIPFCPPLCHQAVGDGAALSLRGGGGGGAGPQTNQNHLISPQSFSLSFTPSLSHPLSPSPCQIEFEVFHLLFHLSAFPGTTWNYLEPGRLAN